MNIRNTFTPGAVKKGPLKSWLSTIALAILGIATTASAQNNNSALQQLAFSYNQQAQADYSQAITWATFNNWPVEQYLPNGSWASIIAVKNGKPIYQITKDLQTAVTITANRVWPGGSLGTSLTGINTRLGVWDDGLPTHAAEFGSRVTSPDNTTNPGGHATNVTGMMAAAGVNANAKGMAYASRIDAYSSFNNFSELATASVAGLRFSNHSYGAVYGWVFGARGDGKWVWFGDPAVDASKDWQWGAYLDGSKNWDTISFNAPAHTLVLAIGNQRGDGPAAGTEHWVFSAGSWTLSTATREVNGGPSGFDTTPGDTTPKNSLVVSACKPLPGGYTGPNSVIAVGFSCWGPTDDGRIKPDLTAPGENLFLPTAGGGYQGGEAGTSFSSPAVCGALGLLNDYYRLFKNQDMTSALARALVCMTANEAGPARGPDYMFGWGLMNTEGAAQVIAGAGSGANLMEMRTLSQGQTLNIPIVVAKSGQVKVAISWTDPAGVVNSPALNNTAPRLVNDLDVRLIRENDQTTFQPWTLGGVANPGGAAVAGDNTVDNIEVIDLANATPGNYTIRITHKGANLSPAGSQPFGLIVSKPSSDGIKEFIIDPDDTVGGTTLNAQVSLIQFATEDTDVQFSSSNTTAVTVPTGVQIKSGSDGISVPIITRPVQKTTTVTISVIAAGDSKSIQVTLRPYGVESVTLDPGSVLGGTGVTGTVTLNSPAPLGGASVNLFSSNTKAAQTTRNWILIPTGTTEGTFAIKTYPQLSTVNVNITASRGETSAVGILEVRAPAMVGLTPATANVKSRGTVKVTLTIDGPASSNGAFIAFSSTNRSVLNPPVGITIPSGQKTASVTLTLGSVTKSTTVKLKATRLGITQEMTINVTP